MFDVKKKSRSSRRVTHSRGKSPSRTTSGGETGSLASEKQKAITSVMQSFAEQTNSAGLEGLRQAFAKIQQRGSHPPTMTTNAMLQNKRKCRYFDIPCIDQTRVILKPWPEAEGDFIHANWVTDEILGKKFICTQGPLEVTAGDFWRMVWQENVDVIIMLCRTIELGKKKCAQYWPNVLGESKTFYGITIKNEKINNNERDILSTELSVCYGGEKRWLTHYQWVTWPDKFVPKHLVVPYTLLSSIRTRTQPTIIHCSAGIGRTGTMVVLEFAIKTLLSGRSLSVSDVVWVIRSQRSKAVQNEEQFLYIHYLIIQRLVNKGAISGTLAMKFCRDYEHYYFTRTHDVQIPLPVYVKKKSTKLRRAITTSLNDRESGEAISVTPRSSTLSSKRRYGTVDERVLAAIRNSAKKRSLLRNPKKGQLDGKEESSPRAFARAITPRKTSEPLKEVSSISSANAKTMRTTMDTKEITVEETPANIWLVSKVSKEGEKDVPVQSAATMNSVMRQARDGESEGSIQTAAQIYPVTKQEERRGSDETVAKICALVKPSTIPETEREQCRRENGQPTPGRIIPDADDVERALTQANKLVRQFLTSRSPIDELYMRFRHAQQALQYSFDQAQFAIALTFAMQQVYNTLPSSLHTNQIPDHPINSPLPCIPRQKMTSAASNGDVILPDVAHTAKPITSKDSSHMDKAQLWHGSIAELPTMPDTATAVLPVANEKPQFTPTAKPANSQEVPNETTFNTQDAKVSLVGASPNDKTDEEGIKTAIPKQPVLETLTTSATIPRPSMMEASMAAVSPIQSTAIHRSQQCDGKSPGVEMKTTESGVNAKSACTPTNERAVGNEDTPDDDEEDSARYVFVQSEWSSNDQSRPMDDAFCEPLSSDSSNATNRTDGTGTSNVVENAGSTRVPVSSYLSPNVKVGITDYL